MCYQIAPQVHYQMKLDYIVLQKSYGIDFHVFQQYPTIYLKINSFGVIITYGYSLFTPTEYN